MAGIGLLGVPANSAGRTDGVAQAPKALRDAGLVDALREVAPVVDHGDVQLPVPSSMRDPETHLIDPTGLRALVEAVSAAVASILGEGRSPLVVGGDCPLLLGCLAAFGGTGDRGLLFVDGHEDAYSPERSTTGEAADMELSFALGMGETPWWPERLAPPPLVASEQVRLLGPRDAAELRKERMRSLAGDLSFVDGERLAQDPEGNTSAAVRSFTGPWWFHLDLDVLSTAALPAVDYPQAGGLDWDQLEVVAKTALAAGPVGWDVTIYNPDLDPTRTHAGRIVRFIQATVGAHPSFSRSAVEG